jgi:hypothetical protein
LNSNIKYLEIYVTRSKTLYWFPKTFYLWTRWYNLYIYNFNNNVKNCGRKDIWCAKSEVIFSTLNVYCMKLRGPGQKLFISSPGPKVQVNYCHHLASVVRRLSSVVCCLLSVVCKLFTFQALWMIIGMSFTKFLFYMPIGNPRWPPSQDID